MNKEFSLQLLDLSILLLLRQKDAYSYDIVKEVYAILNLNEGITYPALKKLENEGFIESYFENSEKNEIKKFYLLTENGKIRCDELIKLYNQVNDKLVVLMKGALL